MDIFAHFLLTTIIFWNQGDVLLFGFIGILPDLLSLTPRYVEGFFAKKHRLKGKRNYTFYKFTHSLVIWFGIAFIVRTFAPGYAIYFYPWIAHIILDIPTHSKKPFNDPFVKEQKKSVFATQIFWPLNKFSFDGVNWYRKQALVVIYTMIVLGLIYRLYF